MWAGPLDSKVCPWDLCTLKAVREELDVTLVLEKQEGPFIIKGLLSTASGPEGVKTGQFWKWDGHIGLLNQRCGLSRCCYRGLHVITSRILLMISNCWHKLGSSRDQKCSPENQTPIWSLFWPQLRSTHSSSKGRHWRLSDTDHGMMEQLYLSI